LCGDVRRPPPGAWDLIVVSYALNEAFAGAGEAPLTAWLEEAAGRLTADGLLIVCEPAETEPGRMAWLRQRAAGLENIHIWSPCLHRGACPLAGRGEGCHDVRRRPAPESVRLLNRRLHRDVVNLKFSSLVVGKRPVGVAVGPEQFRLVAPVRWLKGKWAMTGCAGDGQLRCYEVLQRALSSEQKRGMDRLERGQVLELTEVQARGPVWRGRPRRMT
jgi:ribosomal protein RSM22 (predicted rRNA methylase)